MKKVLKSKSKLLMSLKDSKKTLFILHFAPERFGCWLVSGRVMLRAVIFVSAVRSEVLELGV